MKSLIKTFAPPSHVYVIPVFVWLLTLSILFALRVIQPVVSVLTFLKGSLLLATVRVLVCGNLSVFMCFGLKIHKLI